MATKRDIKKRIEEQEAEHSGGQGGLEVTFRNYRAEDFDDPLDPNYDDVEPFLIKRSGYDENGEWYSETERPEDEATDIAINETVFETDWSADEQGQEEP